MQPLTRHITIINKKGLHARAAAKLVKCASRFEAEIQVRRLHSPIQGELLPSDEASVCARSILGLMMLGAQLGVTLELQATGDDAAHALDAAEALFADRFDEGE